MASRHKNSKSRSHPIDLPVHMPGVYSPVGGYPMLPQWLPPHPPATANYPYQWYQPWPHMPPQSELNPTYRPPVTSVVTAATHGTPSKTNVVPAVPDEYTVNSMRRIYNNDEASIEIERVKVLRRQAIYGTRQNTIEHPSESRSIVPVSSNILNERRPPPRKNKKKGNIPVTPNISEGAIPQGWYPYMAYMPQPFPYPYPFGYIWPFPPPSSVPPGYNPPTDESDCSLSRQETFAPSEDSPDIVIDKSRSPDLQRPLSSAATSHITESLATDIAPSDSVSMRGFKRESSLERLLRKSLESSNEAPDRPTSEDMEKTKEWMEDMQRAFESKSCLPSDVTGDRSSFATAPSDIPTPPTRKQKVIRDTSNNSKISRRKSNSESNIDNPEDQKNLVSLPLLENTRVSDSDLTYAFKNLEHPPNVFKTIATEEMIPKDNFQEDEVDAECRKNSDARDERDSHASTLSFHSTRQSTDDNACDTDSTDITIPIDSSTADESNENFDDSKISEENYKWVLMEQRDTLENLHQGANDADDIIENWRTEVSLWRARLVVSLCRGEGLDQQDWATFQLLVHHPLPMKLKLSLLHAHRLCSQNYDIGVAMLRNALLHLTTFGETLMKLEEERPPGWKFITMDAEQPWVPVKGSVEILKVFGYQVKEKGILKYRRKISPEVSVLARLTLDLLVLAEEFRLFLSGSHQYPVNITNLFTPREAHADKHHSRSSKRHQSSQVSSGIKDEMTNSQRHLVTSSPPLTTELTNEEQKLASSEAALINEFQPKISDSSPNLLKEQTPQIELSPQPSETLSSSTSLPDLHTPTQEILSLKEFESKETLTPSSLIDESENKAERRSSSISDDTKRAESRKTKNMEEPSNTGTRSNSDDHIYEEIGETKAQTEALKSRVSLLHTPPPLPPKAKSSSQGTDIYPHMDWSVSSHYSSVKGSSMRRRKKRRAPRPPDVSPSEEKMKCGTLICDNDGVADKAEISKCEESEISLKNSDFGNPFLEDIKPSGFIGKNPFYEELEFKSGKMEDKHEEIPTEKSMTVEYKLSDFKSSNDDISDVTEISVSNFPAGVRPQRKKEKTSNSNKAKQAELTSNSLSNNEKNNKSSETDSIPSISTLKKTEGIISPVIRKKKTFIPPEPPKFRQNLTPKNEEWEHQRDSQVVVSNKNNKTGDDLNKGKKDVIIQKIFITYDINLDDADQSEDKKNTHNLLEDVSEEKPSDCVKGEKADLISSIFNGDSDEKSEGKNVPAREVENLNSNESQSKPTNKNSNDLDINETQTETLAFNPSNVESSPQLNDNNSGKMNMVEMKDTNQPDVEFSQTLEKPKINGKEKSSDGETPPPTLPPKALLRLLDDIPYIDTNEVESYKASYNTFEGKQHSSHYGITEVLPPSPSYSVSCGEEKVKQFIKKPSHIIFNDSSDQTSQTPNVHPAFSPYPTYPPPSPPRSQSPFSPSFSLPLQQKTFPPSGCQTFSLPAPTCHLSLSERISDGCALKPPLQLSPRSPSSSPSLTVNNSPPDTLPLSPPPPPPLEEVITLNESLLLKDEHKTSSQLFSNENLANIKLEESKEGGNPLSEKSYQEVSSVAQKPLPADEGILVTDLDDRPQATKLMGETSSDSLSHTQIETAETYNRKEVIFFGDDAKAVLRETNSLQSEGPPYETSKTSHKETEERYEIPDVTRATAGFPALVKDEAFSELSNKDEKCHDSIPQRPVRVQVSCRAPPPRPPKPADLQFPPELPPKTGGLKSVSAPSITQRCQPTPSPLVKVCGGKVKFEEQRKSNLSTNTFPPSADKTESNTSSIKSKPKALSLSSLHPGEGSKKKAPTTSRTLPRTYDLPTQSVSMPCSPKVRKNSRKVSIRDNRKTTQRSWPSLLCDCVYPSER